MITVKRLRTEYLTNPIGIDAKSPRFSWVIISDQANVMQTGYRILAAEDENLENIIWDSQEVQSDESRFVVYEGPELHSRQKVYWNVTVHTSAGSVVSETSYFEMGLLDLQEWNAKWIEIPEEEDIEAYNPAQYLRKTFSVKPGLTKARIFQSAHGLYEFWINGKRCTEDIFKPGFTSYYNRVQYQEYDISDDLKEGNNAWSILVGDGWWRGTLGGRYRNNFGYRLAFIGQIILDYADGTSEIIATDESVKYSYGPLLMNDLKYGEIYDAQKELTGWHDADYDDSSWNNVKISEEKHTGKELLISSRSVPVREQEHFTPTVFRDAEGSWILDYGQNLVGYVHMVLHNAERGTKVSLKHGEDIKDGVFYVGNVCTGLSNDTHFQQVDYIAAGKEIEEFQPMFSYSGFRYVKVEGLDGPIDPKDFTAIAVYSDTKPTGNFSCSNNLINQLVSNSRWSQKGNFLEVPTDCPTRERSAWVGDAQLYSKTAARFMDVYSFFEKWMLDVKEEQYNDGKIPNSVPASTSMHLEEEVDRLIRENKCNVFVPGVVGVDGRSSVFDGSAGWSDVATILPMSMYLSYGDVQIIKNQYDTAKKWVDYMITSAKDCNDNRLDQPEYHTNTFGVPDAEFIFDTKFHFGEWLEPLSEESGDPSNQDIEAAKKRTDAPVATAYMYHSSVLLSQMAELLGKADDQKFYKEYSEKVKVIYNKYFIKEDGSIVKGHQAPNVRSLQFDLCNDDNRVKVAEKLVEYIRDNGMCLNTGFLSTPFLLFQLVRNGYVDEAYEVLEQTKSPSWLHAVTLGATTIPEDWTGLDEHINSFNHYSYGAVSDFLFGVTCGIEPVMDRPGYKHFMLKPVPGGTLTNARASFDSPFGLIRSEWSKLFNGYQFEFEVPANTTATIILPNGEEYIVGSGVYQYQI